MLSKSRQLGKISVHLDLYQKSDDSDEKGK